jgi:type IV fimbrial biogenesis protein FimT
MAVPSFGAFAGRSASLAAESDFINAVSLARSEAQRRGVPVVLTANAPAAGNAFGNGWTVWVDSNGNGTLDAGEPLVRTRGAFSNSVVLGDGTVTQIAFNQQGFLAGGAAVQLKACSSAVSGLSGYLLTILPGGVIDVRESVACP